MEINDEDIVEYENDRGVNNLREVLACKAITRINHIAFNWNFIIITRKDLQKKCQEQKLKSLR